jgi:UrcA family protein
MTMTYRRIFTLLSLFALAAPALAQAAEAGDRISVRATHIDRHPASPRAARRTLGRLEAAALEACGASSFSLYEIRQAVRASDCWREAMKDAVAQIGNPLLRQVYADKTGNGAEHAL